MKYTNILGKDFKTKKDAWKYFKFQLYSIEQEIRGHRAVDRHTKFTEEPLIKHSQMQYLFINYLTKDKETLNEVFDGSVPYSWWCKFNNNGTRNLGFEIETRLQGIIPIRPDRIFTCFGAATTNSTLEEKKTARKLIQYQSDDFLRKFLKEGEYLSYNSVFTCDNCKCYEKLEVHHLTPFNDIFEEWRENVWKKDLLPNSSSTYFQDKEANENWCDFHLNLAHYQKLCKPCHAKETYA